MDGYPPYAEERRQRAVSELASYFGVEGFLNSRGIVISKTDAARLMSSVPMKRDSDWLNHGHDQLWGIPLEVAPDWTCDPASVAWARFIASWIVALHLRQIVAWLDRPLSRFAR